MSRLLPFSCMFLLALGLCAQSSVHKRVYLLMEKADQEGNPLVAKQYLDSLLLLDIELPDSLRFRSFLEYGVVYGKQYKNDSAKYYFNQIVDSADPNEFTRLVCEACNGLGNVARSEGDNDGAMFYFSKGLELINGKPEFLEIESLLNGAIAGIYYDLGNFEKAAELMERCIEISLELEIENHIATNYTRMSYLHAAMNQPQKAIEYGVKAQERFISLSDTLGLIYNYYSIGTSHLGLGDSKEAKRAFNLCRKLAKNFREVETLVSATVQLGKIHLESNQTTIAQGYALEALRIAKEENIPIKIREALELQYQIQLKRGNYKVALDVNNEIAQITDSIDNVDIQNRINELRAQYESEKKEQEIANLTLENELRSTQLSQVRWQMAFILAGAFSLISLAIFLYWLKVKRIKSEQLEQQLRFEALQKRYLELLNGPAKIDFDIELDEFNKRLFNPLTVREYDVLKLSLSGKTNQEIADATFVSLSTIKFHMGNIYNKLGVSNKKEAFEYVVKSS